MTVQIYSPGTIPDDVFFSCRRLLLETSLATQSKPSPLHSGKITALPFAPDLTEAWRKHAHFFVALTPSSGLQGFLITFSGNHISEILKLVSYRHKTSLVDLYGEWAKQPESIYIIDLLVTDSRQRSNHNVTGSVARFLLNAVFTHFPQLTGLAYISPYNSYMMVMAQRFGFRILAPNGDCISHIPNAAPLQPNRWVPFIRPSHAVMSDSGMASSSSDSITLSYCDGRASLAVPRSVLRNARKTHRDASLLDNIAAGLLGTTRFDASVQSLQSRSCPFYGFNEPSSYSASDAANDYEPLSRQLQKTTYTEVQKVIDSVVSETRKTFGVSDGFCLDIGSGRTNPWNLPDSWTLEKMNASHPLVLRHVNLTKPPFLRQDIVLLVHVLIRLVHFSDRKEDVYDYLPEAKQWFAHRLLSAVLNRGVTAVIVEPQLHDKSNPDINTIRSIMAAAFERCLPVDKPSLDRAEFWAASWWYALAERFMHPLVLDVNPLLKGVITHEEIEAPDFGSEIRTTKVHRFSSPSRLLYEVTFYDIHGRTEMDYLPGLIGSDDYNEALDTLLRNNRLAKVRFAEALDRHIDSLQVRPSSRPYLLVVSDVAPVYDVDADILPLIFPSGFVLDCSDAGNRTLKVWGGESLPHYLVGSYDIQNDELHRWMRSDPRYKHLKTDQIIGVTVCRFVREFGGYCTRSAVYAWNAESIPLSAILTLSRELEGEMNRFVEITIKRLFLESRRHETIAAIAAQSLSHNIGSHALSDAKLFSALVFDGDGLKDFHQYLQGRLDYVAQLIARTPPQPEPLYFWGDLLGELFRQRLLLNRLVADRSVEGPRISFIIEVPLSKCPQGMTPLCSRAKAIEIVKLQQRERNSSFGESSKSCPKTAASVQAQLEPLRECVAFKRGEEIWQVLGVCWADIELALGLHAVKDDGPGTRTGIPMVGPLEDLLVAIPGGGVGRHALYSILENLIRNSVKYGERRKASNDLCIHLRVRNPDTRDGELNKSVDYWLLEIWDEFSGFGNEVEQQERYEQLAESFRQDVIDDEGKTRTSGHGLVEIKEAMRFLHDHKDNSESDETGHPSPWACRPHCHRTSPAHGKSICSEGCQQGKTQCCHANLANIFDADYDGIPHKVGTLVYRVRLRRPRLLGVWAPGLDFVEEECSSVSKGVFFRKSLIESEADRQTLTELSPHLLVIRDPTEGDVKEMVKSLAVEHWRLPFRLFVVTDESAADATKENSRTAQWETAISDLERLVPTEPDRKLKCLFLPKNRVRIRPSADLHGKLGNPTQEWLTLAFVNEVYDHWLMAYKPLPEDKPFKESDKWHLAVCFERDEKTIKELWKAAEDKKVVSLQSLSVTACYYQKAELGGPLGDTPAATLQAVGWDLEQVADSEAKARRLIHFGNHGCKPAGAICRDAIQRRTVAFSQDFGSTEAPRTFTLLYSPPTDADGFVFFALSLAEAALTKIAIFDERALGVFLSEDPKTKKLSRERSGAAALGGIHPLLTLNAYNARNAALAVENLDWADMNTSKPTAPTGGFLYPIGRAGRFAAEELYGADLLVLHEGLIEELVSKDAFIEGSELCYFDRFAQVVRTSGKGRDARKLDTRLPFCEYSALSNVLAPYNKSTPNGDEEKLRLDKIMLAKSVMNTFGQMQSEENRP